MVGKWNKNQRKAETLNFYHIYFLIFKQPSSDYNTVSNVKL